jgi:hypothetical protein
VGRLQGASGTLAVTLAGFAITRLLPAIKNATPTIHAHLGLGANLKASVELFFAGDPMFTGYFQGRRALDPNRIVYGLGQGLTV